MTNLIIPSDNKYSPNETRHKVFPFLLGLLSANNVVYLFVVSNTPVLLFYVYASLLFVFMFAIDNSRFSLKFLVFELKLFITFVFISGISVLLFNPSYIKRWIVGIIMLFLFFVGVYDVFLFRKDKEYIYKGIIVGITINFLMVAYETVNRLQGRVVNLADVFPAMNIARLYVGNAIRCQGFFCEPGHLMRYLAIVFFLLLPWVMKYSLYKRLLLLLIVITISSLTRSNSLLFFVLGVLFLFVLSNSKKKKLWKEILLTFVILIVSVLLARGFPFAQRLIDGFVEGMISTFKEVNGESDRIIGMKGAFFIIRQYPLIGCGWNLLTSVMSDNGLLISGQVTGSFSFVLSLFAELGIGASVIIVFFIRRSFFLIKQKSSFELMCCGVGLLVYFGISIATDYGFEPGVVVLFGVVLSFLWDNQKGVI